MRKLNKGFTLIELLVVVGILGILAVAALVSINPLEAQRKARDSARMKGITTLQSAIEQYINDNGATSFTRNSSLAAVAGKSCAATGWLGLNVCPYLQALPIDPLNGKTIAFISSATGTRTTAVAQYKVNMTANGEFAVSARLEAVQNFDKLSLDGAPDLFFTAFSNVAAVSGSTF